MFQNSFLLILHFTLSFYSFIALAVNPPYGKLSVNNKGHLIGYGHQVQLHGISLYFSQWMSQFYNKNVIRGIKCLFNGNIASTC